MYMMPLFNKPGDEFDVGHDMAGSFAKLPGKQYF